MSVLPVVLLLGANVSIGAFMAWRYLLGQRNPQSLAALHFLFGAGGVEVMALVLRGAPNGSATGMGGLGPVAALVLAGALLTGLFVPIIAKPKPAIIGWSIAVHGTIATIGFGLLLIWALRA